MGPPQGNNYESGIDPPKIVAESIENYKKEEPYFQVAYIAVLTERTETYETYELFEYEYFNTTDKHRVTKGLVRVINHFEAKK